MNIKLFDLIQNKSENEILEFKETNNNYDFDKLDKYFSVLSNEANLSSVSEAWLIFGVNDKCNIVGTQFRPNYADLQSLKKQGVIELADQKNWRLTIKN